MTNKQIARLLRETASLIELTGGNPYRARAFSNASRTIDGLDVPVTDYLEANEITELPGIGSGMADEIGELLAHGTLSLREELLSSLPEGLPELLRVKGLGTKKVRRLWQEADVTTLDELEFIASSGRLAQLDGFGSKTQENVLENVRQLRKYQKRRRYADVVELVHPVLETLSQADGVERAEPSGALRRKLETIERADLVVLADDASDVEAALRKTTVQGPARAEGDDVVFEGKLPDGLPIEVRVLPRQRFGTSWWWHTGAEAHCQAFQDAYGAPEAFEDEEALYDSVGLDYIEPELRENQGELEAASDGALPDLITVDDLRGTLHNHSTYSDGAHSLPEMAQAAREMGLTYFGICDHSQSLKIANGLSVERVGEQQEEIRRLNHAFSQDGTPFRIFSGIESDILSDGSLDYPDEILASFDFVVASIHSGFSMTEEEATARVITALENPHTSILGHATGRLLLSREGYPLNHKRVIEACAANNVAIELNANPYRLDMDWRYLHRAIEQGVLISINPDAHSIEELHHVHWGVEVARKGWLTAASCLNAKSLDAFSSWLEERHSTRAA